MGIISRVLRCAAKCSQQLSVVGSPPPLGSSRRRKRPFTFRPTIEQLEIRLTPHANVVLDAEHLAVFGMIDANTGVVTGGLAPDAAATYRSITSGVWSN